MNYSAPNTNSNFIKRILIVDDDDMDRYALRRNIITALPAREISEAESGEKALSLLAGRASLQDPMPELIFLDLNMSPMTGLEFLDVFEKLSTQHRNHCRIVMVCAKEDEKEKQVAMSYAHVAGYYVKPLSIETLMHISDHLEHRQAS